MEKKITKVDEYPKGISEIKFNELVSTNDLVIIDVYADWCQPCLEFKPIFEEISEQEEYKDIKFISINSDEAIWINSRFDIDSIPRFLFFNNKKLIYEHVGASEKEVFEFQINYRFFDSKILNDMENGISEKDFNELLAEHLKLVLFAYDQNDNETEFFKPYIALLKKQLPDVNFVLVNAEKSEILKSLIPINQPGHHVYPQFFLFKDGDLQHREHIHHPDILEIQVLDFLMDVSPVKRYETLSEEEFQNLNEQNSKSVCFIYKKSAPANSMMKSFLYGLAEKHRDLNLYSVDYNKNKWIAEKFGIVDEEYTKFGETGEKKLPYFLFYKNNKLLHETGPIEMESFMKLAEEI